MGSHGCESLTTRESYPSDRYFCEEPETTRKWYQPSGPPVWFPYPNLFGRSKCEETSRKMKSNWVYYGFIWVYMGLLKHWANLFLYVSIEAYWTLLLSRKSIVISLIVTQWQSTIKSHSLSNIHMISWYVIIISQHEPWNIARVPSFILLVGYQFVSVGWSSNHRPGKKSSYCLVLSPF